MADAKGDKAGTTPVDQLSEFLNIFAQLPKVMVDGMLNQAENEDEKEVIRTLGGTLSNQFLGLTEYIQEQGGGLSAHQRNESGHVLRISSAGSLVASGSSLAANLTSQVAKIGLAGIIREIKKIIRMLLEAFGIKIPKWLEAVLLLIDELVNLLFSTGSPALATTLSRMEQEHLVERAYLVRLQREEELRSELDSEEKS